jgi:transposase
MKMNDWVQLRLRATPNRSYQDEDIQIANILRKPKPKKDEQGKYIPNNAAAKGGLSKSIHDAGWGQFMALCSSKAEEAGRTVVEIHLANLFRVWNHP